MAVNTLVTGLIVFKILKVFLEVRAISGEMTLGSLASTGGSSSKLRHVLFVIIESGMALFVIQLIRIVIISFTFDTDQQAVNFVAPINQMLNVSIRSVHFHPLFFFSFVLLMTFYLARASHQP
jgi:hypothetical protein